MSIHGMINSTVRCTICGAKGVGTCNCWATCWCGWSYRNIKGERCGNPAHQKLDSSDAASNEHQPKGKL